MRSVLTCVFAAMVPIAAAAVCRAQGDDPGAMGPRVPPARSIVWGPPALGPASAAATVVPSRSFEVFTPAGADGGVLSAQMDWDLLSHIAASPGAFIIRGFPLDATVRIDLAVERFWITSERTRFVAGGIGSDAALAFDPGSVVLLRGFAVGHAHSRVFLGLARGMSNGIIDLGPGEGQYALSSRSREGPAIGAGLVSIFRAPGGGPNPIESCLADTSQVRPPPPGVDAEPRRGLRQLQLAVETDHEFFVLFNDEAATLTYLMQVYGAVSEIYMRELNIRIDLPFLRVWPLANEPFNASLGEFQSYWSANMGSVSRDAAQMFTGRADLPGGVAYLSSLCNGSAYSFCGNAVGYFADPRGSNVFNYDPQVAAHELGHNCGTGHTHDYGLDTCDQLTTPARRGTIMSYCNQTVSGAMSCMDMGFHKVTRNAIFAYVPTASCVVFDCNQNGRADSLDIAMGFSADANGNGIPDECEDCNHNNVLDSIDIATGTSRDLNNNGIPDECEPDCNGNQVPDDRDIALGTSQDLYGDGVPDECDADLNHNNVSDYNEIMANMTLDKDRNRILDAFEDCDHDGTTDLVALDGAHDGWVASLAAEGAIREYHSITGVLMRVSPVNSVSQAQDLIITPDRRILVSSLNTSRVVEFDRSGNLVRTLVASGSGGLSAATGMMISAAGTLLVVSQNTASVLEYNLTSGAFIRAFIAPGTGLESPFGLTRGPNGNIYVSCAGAASKVQEYNGTTGAFVRTLVPTASGSLSDPHGLVFKPDGNLLVTSTGNDQVKEYNGTTGAFIRNWLVLGSTLTLDGPWCIRIGHDGLVYVSRNQITDTHLTRARIYIFDTRNGNFVRAYVQAQDSGLSNPTGFDFMPGDATDCNRNAFPDNCDIARGYSTDYNGNGVPDECERACYANCDLSVIQPVLNVNDFICFQANFAAAVSLPYSRQITHYANCDGSQAAPVLNVNDFVCFQMRFAAGCP